MPHNGHDGPAIGFAKFFGRSGIGHDIKLHRRTMTLDGRAYTVLGLRPTTRERFAVNHFHDTWHIVTHRSGATLLGTLLWGMAYQRVPNTILVIDRAFLDDNPFDAEPSPPIVVAPAESAPFGDRAARELRRRLPLSGRSEGTVRLRAVGLPTTDAGRAAWFRAHPRRFHGHTERLLRPVIGVRAGLLVLPGTTAWLREWAVQIASLNPAVTAPYAPSGMDYDYIHDDNSLEVQVFTDYHDRVTAARVARDQVAAEAGAPQDPAERRELLWSRSARVHARMRRNRTARYTRAMPKSRTTSPS